MTAPVVFSVGESDDVMVRWPDGRVQFVPFWRGIVLMFRLVWRRQSIEFEGERVGP